MFSIEVLWGLSKARTSIFFAAANSEAKSIVALLALGNTQTECPRAAAAKPEYTTAPPVSRTVCPV
jgi:hypothetical protein